MGPANDPLLPRVVLCSSDDFGLPTLEALADVGWLAGLITQPDRPRGRGRVATPLPIRTRAESLGVPVLTPEKIDPDEIRPLTPDYLVIASYAHYLPKSVREVPRKACLNIHPSDLPRYRGPSPIRAPLWCGDESTGISIHFTVREIDAGDILAQELLAISPEWDAGALEGVLAESGASLLMKVIHDLERGTAHARPQEHASATLTRKLTALDRHIDFHHHAEELHHRIRALAPEPAAQLPWDTEELLVLRSRVEYTEPEAPPGTPLPLGKGRLGIRAGGAVLELLEVQPPGKKPMAVNAWLNGLKGPWPELIPSRSGDPRALVIPLDLGVING